MKTPRMALALLTVALGVGGCASDSNLTQKEKDRMAREMERENQKQAKSQEKMLRGTNASGMGGQRTGAR